MDNNRQIKFREYLPDGRPEKFHYWGLIDGNFIAPCNPKNTHDRFTGLTDKEGKEIYEGDVVECYDHPTGVDNVTGRVYFEQGHYKVDGSIVPLHDYGTAWTKVIGTIHQ